MENFFLQTEMEYIKKEIAALDKNFGSVYESGTSSLRALNGAYKISPFFKKLCSHRKLLSIAQKILKSDVYVHQFKINFKPGFDGDVWEWHQDHLFWHKEDGMPRPNAITATIFLTESNEFNGPLMLIPGSHHLGTVDIPANTEGWESTLTARLKYTLPNDLIKKEVEKSGLYSAKAKPGDVFFFHSNAIHGSTKNISPYDRVMLLITYNSVDNKLLDVPNPRPEFLANRDFTPLTPIDHSEIFLD